MGWLVGIISTCLLFVISLIGSETLSNDLFAAIGTISIVLMVFFCIKYSKFRKRRKEQRAEKAAQDYARRVVEDNLPTGYSEIMSVKHMDGLPWGEQAACSVYLYPDRYVFWRNKNTYTLSMDKITDVCIKTDIEIQKAYVSSVGGAVGGAVLFGTLGAMIGGRVKKKRDTTISKFLIFTYNKDGETKYISFEIPSNNKNASKFVEMYQAQASGHQNFQL